MASRHAQRKHLDQGTRLYLIDGDLDELESAVAKVSATLNKILWTLVTMLVSIATACVLLALNLVVGA